MKGGCKVVRVDGNNKRASCAEKKASKRASSGRMSKKEKPKHSERSPLAWLGLFPTACVQQPRRCSQARMGLVMGKGIQLFSSRYFSTAVRTSHLCRDAIRSTSLKPPPDWHTHPAQWLHGPGVRGRRGALVQNKQ